MELREIRQSKAELETEIFELIQEFTTKTNIYVREIALYGQLQAQAGMVEDKRLNIRVEVKTSL